MLSTNEINSKLVLILTQIINFYVASARTLVLRSLQHTPQRLVYGLFYP